MDWRLEDHCVGGDAVTVSINIMRVVMGMPFRVKPGLHIGWFGLGVEYTVVEQSVGRNIAFDSGQEACSRADGR